MSYVSSIQSSLQSGYYGLVNLSLASMAYISSKDPSGMASAFNTAIGEIQPLPNPQDGTQLPAGNWVLEWGPAVDASNSNLCYVAAYQIDGANVLRVVGLRGTAVSDGTVSGLMEQLMEDLSAFIQIDWMATLAALSLESKYNPFGRKVVAGSSIMVAEGSTQALLAILGASVVSGGVGSGNLIGYLYSQPDISTTPLVVTGHSLGGALTQVVSTYLAWQIGGSFTKLSDYLSEPQLKNIFPAAFAPPTVGSPTFASIYDRIFPYNFFYYNNGDVVPYAYVNVQGIENLWANYDTANNACTHAPCPSPLATFITNNYQKIPPYARPTNNTISLTADYMCNGTCMTDFLTEVNMTTAGQDAWLAQLCWQHFPPCYYQCMTTQQGLTLAPYNSFIPIPTSCSSSS